MKLLVDFGNEFVKIYDKDDLNSPQITFSASTPVPLPVALAIAEKIITDDYEVLGEYGFESTVKMIKITFDTMYGSDIRSLTKLSKTVIAMVQCHKSNDYLVLNVSI